MLEFVKLDEGTGPWHKCISDRVIFKARLSSSKNILCYLLDWKPFRSDEKCFLFHLKSSFCSQDIYVFVTNFWSCRKNGLILKFSFKIHDVTIVIHIMPNISQSKDNQTMEFGQLIEYNKGNIFLEKLCRKRGRETSSRPLFIFWKSLIWGESKWSAASFQCILIALNLPYNKNKQYKTLDHWFRDMVNFSFPEKGLGLVLPNFVYDFSTKMFLMLYSFTRPNFIAWLPLLLERLDNICITIVCEPGCDVIKFEKFEINVIMACDAPPPVLQLFTLPQFRLKTKNIIIWS